MRGIKYAKGFARIRSSRDRLLLTCRLAVIATVVWPVAINSSNEQASELEEAERQAVIVQNLYEQGKYGEATPIMEHALAIVEMILEPKDPITAKFINNLAELYLLQGRCPEAEQLLKRSEALFEKTAGSGVPLVTAYLSNLALCYQEQGQYAKAEPLFERTLAIDEKVLGKEDPEVVSDLTNLGVLYRIIGQYSKAESLYMRALDILEKRGLKPSNIAPVLNNLALLYRTQGRYGEAEWRYKRALDIWVKALGPDHPNVASAFNNLAALYRAQGQYAKAEPLYMKALAIREKVLPPGDPDVAAGLNNLAALYYEIGWYAKAEPLFQRALTIRESALGLGHLEVAQSLNNLAVLYKSQGRHVEAEQLYARARAIQENALGPSHPEVATSLNNLALLYQSQSRYVEAESLYQQALAIKEKALGPQHPELAITLHSMAMLHYAQKQYVQAIGFEERATTISEHNASLNVAVGAEPQKLAYMMTLSGEMDGVLSLDLDAVPQSRGATRLALRTLLQRKGRVLDVSTEAMATLRQHLRAEERAVLDRLQKLRGELSALVNRGLGSLTPENYRARLSKLEADADVLGGKLSARSAEFRAQSMPITLEDVQILLPKDAALLELAVYQPFNPRAIKDSEKYGEPQYAAYVVHPKGEPCSVRLGAAKDIEPKVDSWRHGLDAKSGGVARGQRLLSIREEKVIPNIAHSLYRNIMAPIRDKCLGNTKTIFFSPDGVFNLVPIGALIDDAGHYLIEDYHITYLTSGRDLLRLQNETPNRGEAVVVSNPDYGSKDDSPYSKDGRSAQITVAEGNDRQRRSRNFAGQVGTFDRLEKAAEEAEAVKKLLRLPKGQWLTDKRATEGAVKALHGPQILHIATHGFFLQDEKDELLDRFGLIGEERQAEMPRTENPLLRSGLALAGANRLRSGEDDGILTALEASGLDLWGTKLVVLSACETGVGDVRTGEVVYGLRRALVNAGSESQVLSLWRVDDLGTKDLMFSYYRMLLAGEGRSEALRQAQLELLHSTEHSHPYYWAAFIPSGQWKSLKAGVSHVSMRVQ